MVRIRKLKCTKLKQIVKSLRYGNEYVCLFVQYSRTFLQQVIKQYAYHIIQLCIIKNDYTFLLVVISFSINY